MHHQHQDANLTMMNDKLLLCLTINRTKTNHCCSLIVNKKYTRAQNRSTQHRVAGGFTEWKLFKTTLQCKTPFIRFGLFRIWLLRYDLNMGLSLSWETFMSTVIRRIEHHSLDRTVFRLACLEVSKIDTLSLSQCLHSALCLAVARYSLMVLAQLLPWKIQTAQEQ